MVEIDIEKKLNMAEGWKNLAINVKINQGEFVTVFGESGAGKTTLLRMIAGLSLPDSGFIRAENQVWYDAEKKHHLSVQQRDIGFVFQTPALFPNMNVMENLCYGAGKNYDSEYLKKLLHITSLESLSNRKTQTLSGGQQQRVSLIRALARKPKLLLLDEPFSSLDVSMRIELREALFKLHQELQLTTILVSHDLEDINTSDNRLIEISNGKNHERNTFPTSAPNQWIGKIRSITQAKIGFLIEIHIENDIVKLPIDATLASRIKEDMSVQLSMHRQQYTLQLF